jgi:hypothetical protein
LNYIEALDHLDAAAEHFATRMATQHPGWRLHVRPRGGSNTSQVELHHWSESDAGGSWEPVAHVSCVVGSDRGGVRLVTHISCTMCGHWSQEQPRARGLQQLFDIADMFEEFTAGKVFES